MTNPKKAGNNFSTEITDIKKIKGFENVSEEEILEFFFKFKEISGGNVFIDIDQFHELLNSFGVVLNILPGYL